MHRILLAILFVCSAGLIGCGGGVEGPQTVTVTGNITFDGAPLPEGELIFRPAGGGEGRADAATIKDGEFSMESTLGQKRVEIRALRTVAGAVETTLETGETGTDVEQYIPEQYNDKSTLTADITDTSGTLEFPLTSK